MRKLRAALGAAIAIVALGVPGAAAAGTPLTITVKTVPGKVVRHAYPPAGDKGDELTSTVTLLDPRTGAKVGTMTYTFTILQACKPFTTPCRARALVNTTTVLRDGAIMAGGRHVPTARITIAVPVSGGTGRYADAKGSLTFGLTSTHTNVYKLWLRPGPKG
jgi:hypothetical protein